jgi:hypothetical protein
MDVTTLTNRKHLLLLYMFEVIFSSLDMNTNLQMGNVSQYTRLTK